MKKLFKYIGLFLSLVVLGAFTACNIQQLDDSKDAGLNIKVFFPTKVVAGQPMTISGSGFTDAKEVVFPGNVSVTDFELAGDGMIRLTAPAGIAAEGGKLVVRSSSDQAESRLDLTVGKTVVSGYSKQAGETAEGGELITIYGKDLEFINAVELLDADGNPNLITAENFYRRGTSSVIFYVPAKNIFEGTFAGKVYTYDSNVFIMPELAYKPKQESGHWETKITYLWKNETGDAIPSWGGTFRFGLEGNDGNNECIATFPADVWNLIKEDKVRVAVDVNDASNIRITTGWWTGAYGGADHNCTDMLLEEEDGTKYIELDIKGDGNLYDNIDVQHLLFTGDAYTLLYIYTVEQEWVPGEAGHWERKSFWKNETGDAIPSWGGTFRFGLEGNDGNNECIATFPADVWNLIKEDKVRVAVDVNDASNIRITTGWWTGAYGGADHNCTDMILEEEDGTKYIELNIKEDGNIYDLIDVQHLLFTGDAYTLLEIYVNEWVAGGGSEPDPVVFWENGGSLGEVSWGGDYRFGLDGHDGNNECCATFAQDIWDIIKTGTFYLVAKGSDWPQIRVTTGWWSVQWMGADNDIKPDNMAERMVDNGDGTFTVEINFGDDPIVGSLDEQHLLFTGSGYTPLKLYHK
ncbi:MAG: hypothetical protein MJZ17_02110 [Bacteroidales bacterium]|nr:hypothetical protein [Bacteroidales bacterium]